VLVSRVKFRDVLFACVGLNYRVAYTPYAAAVDASWRRRRFRGFTKTRILPRGRLRGGNLSRLPAAWPARVALAYQKVSDDGRFVADSPVPV